MYTLHDVLAAFSTTVRDQPGGRIIGYLTEAPIHPDDMTRCRAVLSPPKELVDSNQPHEQALYS
ncbi:hypothetical protein OG302_00850 [Streptomyces sp. NBC_01283]|uniref:hypothetical protein n=1 Tax=Streptomyces sp. NBC_01283 TaxID=2903812 RepID=UPI00352EE445|nr:hypothetical protein OG302_00850 [Streptomyces sp. NBC_01283]